MSASATLYQKNTLGRSQELDNYIVELLEKIEENYNSNIRFFNNEVKRIHIDTIGSMEKNGIKILFQIIKSDGEKVEHVKNPKIDQADITPDEDFLRFHFDEKSTQVAMLLEELRRGKRMRDLEPLLYAQLVEEAALLTLPVSGTLTDSDVRFIEAIIFSSKIKAA